MHPRDWSHLFATEIVCRFFDGQVWTPVESLDSSDAEFPKSCHDLLWSPEKLSDFEKIQKFMFEQIF